VTLVIFTSTTRFVPTPLPRADVAPKPTAHTVTPAFKNFVFSQP
jgi:hypothetical protein